MYVDFRDLDRAKEVIASDPDILEAPQIIGEETVVEAKYEFGPATGKETYPGGYEHDARMITHIVTDLSPRLKDDEVMLDVQNAINRIETNTATKADITLVMDVYKDIVKQKLDKPYKDAIGKFDQDYDPNDPLQNVEEKAKPDYIDIDGDGNKKEPMKKAVKDKEKKEKVKEGKVKAMLMDMEDDASDMSREEFISKYGSHNADVWDDVNNPRDYPEPALNDFVKQDAESVDEGVQRNILYRNIGIMLAKGHDIKRIKKRYKDIDDAHPGHIEKVVQALKDRNEIPYGQYKRVKGADAVQEGSADPKIVAKFAKVSPSQRSYYIMKWAEENGIDSNKAMELAGYKKGDYMGSGAYNWRYVGEDVEDQTKIIRLKMMQDQVEDLKSNFEILTRLDQRGTGAGDLQDQITTMYKAIES